MLEIFLHAKEFSVLLSASTSAAWPVNALMRSWNCTAMMTSRCSGVTLPRQPWQTQRYYDSQRAILRPSTFARLHENKWVSSESSFITPELWDSCIDPDLRPTLPGNKTKAKYVGVDIGLKSDYAAVVIVEREGDRISLARYRLWKPSANNP